jgi:hypothetical protein
LIGQDDHLAAANTRSHDHVGFDPMTGVAHLRRRFFVAVSPAASSRR